MDCVFGFPEGYDPETGQLWINSTGEWFMDEDDEPLNPMYDYKDFDFPVNPSTGAVWGIDPNTN